MEGLHLCQRVCNYETQPEELTIRSPLDMGRADEKGNKERITYCYATLLEVARH